MSNAGSETQGWKVILTKPKAVGTLWFLQARDGQQWGTVMTDQCGQTSQTASRLPALVSSASPGAGGMTQSMKLFAAQA